VASSPTIGTDGTIYIGSQDGYLYAISSTGTFKYAWPYKNLSLLISYHFPGSLVWRYLINSYSSGYYLKAAPVIGSDGTIYIGSTDYYLYAITSTGTVVVTHCIIYCYILV